MRATCARVPEVGGLDGCLLSTVISKKMGGRFSLSRAFRPIELDVVSSEAD